MIKKIVTKMRVDMINMIKKVSIIFVKFSTNKMWYWYPLVEFPAFLVIL